MNIPFLFAIFCLFYSVSIPGQGVKPGPILLNCQMIVETLEKRYNEKVKSTPIERKVQRKWLNFENDEKWGQSRVDLDRDFNRRNQACSFGELCISKTRKVKTNTNLSLVQPVKIMLRWWKRRNCFLNALLQLQMFPLRPLKKKSDHFLKITVFFVSSVFKTTIAMKKVTKTTAEVSLIVWESPLSHSWK